MEKRVCFYEEKPCIIEFQAFRGNENEFIIKELVILDLLKGVIYSFLFKPPHSFKKLSSKAKVTNNWLSKHFHYISWQEGFTSLRTLDNIMFNFCSKFNRIYTRGSEKCNWIQMYTTSEVYDINIDKHFVLENNDLCLYAENKLHSVSNCALSNAYCLATFLKEIKEQSGGGDQEYKYEEPEQTMHEYYSRLRDDNNTKEEKNMCSQQQFLQSLVDQFNAQSKSNVLPTRKCSELKEMKHYIVHAIKKIDTSIGDAIQASLSDAPYTPGDEPKFQIFLPKRFVHLLQNEDMRNIEPGSLYLMSHGVSGTNSTELSLHLNSK